MGSIEKQPIIDQLQELRLVPVVSLPSVEAALKLAELLVRCRLPVIEITYRTACAVEAMTQINKKFPELLLLAGTVLTPDQVDSAIKAGAKAIVSPGFTPLLASYCREKGIPFFPGVFTPSEVQMAHETGLRTLKFFPAEHGGGVKTVAMFKTIYQDVTFMPTGGIKQDNLMSYLEHENILCCGGTWLCPEKLMIAGQWTEIETRLNDAVQLLEQ